MKKNSSTEREFGVPIPGTILDQSQWTQTALKKLPAAGPLDLDSIFGRRAPVIVDIGCGNGRFVLGSALRRPEYDHIGIDILPMVLRYATRRANQRGLANVRFAAIDGQRFLADYLSKASVREIHCYHPQPYHDARDAHKRLLTPEFLALVHRTLEHGGQFFVQTDNAPYWEYLKRLLPSFFDFHEQLGPWPDTPRGRTRRDILAMRRRYPVYRGWGVARSDAPTQIADLPHPTFDAGPRHRDLDVLERE